MNMKGSANTQALAHAQLLTQTYAPILTDLLFYVPSSLIPLRFGHKGSKDTNPTIHTL